MGKSDNMHVWHKFSITRFVSKCIQIIFIWLKFAKVENFNLERQLKVHLFEDQGSIYMYLLIFVWTEYTELETSLDHLIFHNVSTFDKLICL
jgi:hypothetical protein